MRGLDGRKTCQRARTATLEAARAVEGGNAISISNHAQRISFPFKFTRSCGTSYLCSCRLCGGAEVAPPFSRGRPPAPPFCLRRPSGGAAPPGALPRAVGPSGGAAAGISPCGRSLLPRAHGKGQRLRSCGRARLQTTSRPIKSLQRQRQIPGKHPKMPQNAPFWWFYPPSRGEDPGLALSTLSRRMGHLQTTSRPIKSLQRQRQNPPGRPKYPGFGGFWWFYPPSRR